MQINFNNVAVTKHGAQTVEPKQRRPNVTYPGLDTSYNSTYRVVTSNDILQVVADESINQRVNLQTTS